MPGRAHNGTSSGWPLTDGPPSRARPFLGELTGLRFLAALWVLRYHALPSDVHSPAFWRAFWSAGYAGVTLFFALCGFILVYTYGPVDNHRVDIRTFLSARLARLFPVYLAALLIAVPEFVRATMTLAGSPGLDARDVALVVIATPLMLQAWLPRIGSFWNCSGWSLSAEACFYLLFPVLAPLLSARRARTIVLCAAGAWVLALLVADLRTIPFDTAGRFGIIIRLVQSPATPLFRLPEFLLGLAIGRWYLDRRLRGEPLRAGRGLALVVAAAVTIVVIASRSTPDAVDPTLGVYLLPPFAALILRLGDRGNQGVLARLPRCYWARRAMRCT